MNLIAKLGIIDTTLHNRTHCLTISCHCRGTGHATTLDTHYNAHRYSADSVIVLIGSWIPFLSRLFLRISRKSWKILGSVCPSSWGSTYMRFWKSAISRCGTWHRSSQLVRCVWVKTCLWKNVMHPQPLLHSYQSDAEGGEKWWDSTMS